MSNLYNVTETNNSEQSNSLISALSKEYSDVFAPGIGTCTKQFSLKLREHEPVFCKAHTLPLALRGPVEKELDRLEKEGTIVKVTDPEYGTPIVPIIKKCGSLRLCGNYRLTINPVLKREPYPLPRIEELFSALSGGQVFSKIDLSQAYQQVLLDESSRPCTTISTHVGNFMYVRTPYGLNCIPEKFQKMMEEALRGIPNTVVFLDDICVTGQTKTKHLANLREVLGRLQAIGLRVKLSKCEFFKKQVNYLGYVIDSNGLHPDMNKVKAIASAPRPTDVSQLKAFLGLVNYYGKFINQLSTILHPLYALLRKGVDWKWSTECENACRTVKKILCSDKVLTHYDAALPVVLSVDSSAYALGCVLAHRYPDGSERPICFTSRTLNDAEKSYSQLDKEALAIFYGVIKNHQYLFGRKFIIRTDHKPLSYIFGDKVGIPQTAASRLQRYAARLAAYDFSVEWVSSARNGPADALSRLPLTAGSERTSAPDCVSYLNYVENQFPISHREIALETKKDPILAKIYGYVLFGWPDSTEVEQEKPYFYRKANLFVEHGCIVYNYRVVIPPKLRKNILYELHEGHLGIVKMKNIARNYVYWPGLDSEIETLARTCEACRQQRDAPPHAPLVPWTFPARPWHRLHADFCEYKSKHYFIIVDAYTKWIEAFSMSSTVAKVVITKLRELFARFGLPVQVVTDNGPPFTSTEVKDYFKRNGIVHTLTSPYRPQGNGAAENAVKTVKKCIKKAVMENVDVEQAISKMLFHYRNSDHATTGVSPAVALLGRHLRGRLDVLRPSTERRVQEAQARQVERAGGVARSTSPGDAVLARNYGSRGPKWVESNVTEVVGPDSYKLSGLSGATQRHIDQIIKIKTPHRRYSQARPTESNSSEGMSLEQDTDPPPAEGAPAPAVEVPQLLAEERVQEENPSSVSPIGNRMQLRPRLHKRSYVF